MRKHLALALTGALFACAPSGAPEISPAQQASLDAALAGRTAGQPVSCINQRSIRGNEGYGEGAILFTTQSRRVVYVNRPPGGCPSLDRMRALRTTSTTNQLCRGDLVTVFQPTSGIEFGSCSLGDFIPYTR